MKDINSLAHSKWRCQYHIVFAPKYRRQEVYGKIKADNAAHFRPQVAFIRKAPPLSCGGEGLARESAGEDGDGFKSCFLKKRLLRECGDVPELRHIRPMLLQDGIGIVRPLALTDRFKARRLRRKVQPADAGKEADMSELIHG